MANKFIWAVKTFKKHLTNNKKRVIIVLTNKNVNKKNKEKKQWTNMITLSIDKHGIEQVLKISQVVILFSQDVKGFKLLG